MSSLFDCLCCCFASKTPQTPVQSTASSLPPSGASTPAQSSITNNSAATGPNQPQPKPTETKAKRAFERLATQTRLDLERIAHAEAEQKQNGNQTPSVNRLSVSIIDRPATHEGGFIDKTKQNVHHLKTARLHGISEATLAILGDTRLDNNPKEMTFLCNAAQEIIAITNRSLELTDYSPCELLSKKLVTFLDPASHSEFNLKFSATLNSGKRGSQAIMHAVFKVKTKEIFKLLNELPYFNHFNATGTTSAITPVIIDYLKMEDFQVDMYLNGYQNESPGGQVLQKFSWIRIVQHTRQTPSHSLQNSPKHPLNPLSLQLSQDHHTDLQPTTSRRANRERRSPMSLPFVFDEASGKLIQAERRPFVQELYSVENQNHSNPANSSAASASAAAVPYRVSSGQDISHSPASASNSQALSLSLHIDMPHFQLPPSALPQQAIGERVLLPRSDGSPSDSSPELPVMLIVHPCVTSSVSHNTISPNPPQPDLLNPQTIPHKPHGERPASSHSPRRASHNSNTAASSGSAAADDRPSAPLPSSIYNLDG